MLFIDNQINVKLIQDDIIGSNLKYSHIWRYGYTKDERKVFEKTSRLLWAGYLMFVLLFFLMLKHFYNGKLGITGLSEKQEYIFRLQLFKYSYIMCIFLIIFFLFLELRQSIGYFKDIRQSLKNHFFLDILECNDIIEIHELLTTKSNLNFSFGPGTDSYIEIIPYIEASKRHELVLCDTEYSDGVVKFHFENIEEPLETTDIYINAREEYEPSKKGSLEFTNTEVIYHPTYQSILSLL